MDYYKGMKVRIPNGLGWADGEITAVHKNLIEVEYKVAGLLFTRAIAKPDWHTIAPRE